MRGGSRQLNEVQCSAVQCGPRCSHPLQLDGQKLAGSRPQTFSHSAAALVSVDVNKIIWRGGRDGSQDVMSSRCAPAMMY